MGYNVLSGSTSAISVISSGSFVGDGSGLENVEQFELFNASAARIPFYKISSGDFALDGNGGFVFENNALTVPGLTSSVGIRLSNPISGALAGNGSFIGIDTNGNMVLTSSAAGTGPSNSLQFHTSGGLISGSSKLSYASDTLTLSGTFAVTGSLLPSGSAVYNLGSTTQRWNQIFLGSGSLHLGTDCRISSDDDIGTIDINKPLKVVGGVAASRHLVTSSITASNLSFFIGVSASSAINIQMPGAQTLSSGQMFVIKDEGGNAGIHNITVKSSGSQTIDGESSIILESPYASVNLYTNGSDKFFIY